MPAVRTKLPMKTSAVGINFAAFKFKDQDTSSTRMNGNIRIDHALQSKDSISFPTTEAERVNFRTKDGKKVTAQQWAVYDLTRTIPCGRVTTYKRMCTLLGEGSPRSVGSALRKNPFAPFVPCHRVIASDLSLGGFYGEKGTENVQGSLCAKKVEMLSQEGVRFSKTWRLEDGDTSLWKTGDDVELSASEDESA